MRNDKKKLCFITISLEAGGAEKILVDLLNELDRNKYKISIIVFVFKGIYCKDIPGDIEVYKILNNRKGKFDILWIIFKCIKTLFTINPDIVISFMFLPNVINMICKVLFIGTKSKTILCERSLPSFYITTSTFSAIKKQMIKFLYNISDKVIVISNGIKRDLIENFAINPKIIVMIYNGIDFKKINRLKNESIIDFERHIQGKNNSRIIISCSRLVNSKNINLLIKAFSLIKYKNYYLLILGDGEEIANLKMLTVKLDVAERVIFQGFVNNPYKYFSKADIFVLPSKWEGFGNVIIEAMACGLPVIATDCEAGPKEIINDQYDGIIAINDNALDLKNKIELLVSNHQLYNKIMKRGKIKAKEFSIQKMALNYSQVFDSLF